jgi:hypothetical protein
MMKCSRIRKSLMPTMAPMEIDGGGLDHSNKLTPAKAVPAPTNIEVLTKKLEQVSLKSMAKEAKKRKKPKYINTSALLKFSRVG